MLILGGSATVTSLTGMNTLAVSQIYVMLALAVFNLDYRLVSSYH